MGVIGRALSGAVGGAGATAALTVLRKGMARAGLVDKTAPEQVIERLEELGLLDGWSAGARRLLAVAAHLGYGVGIGASFGALRRKGGERGEEAAVGAALGVLSWGVNWASWLPLAGVHEPPGSSAAPRCCCRSWTTPSSAPCGASCTDPSAGRTPPERRVSRRSGNGDTGTFGTFSEGAAPWPRTGGRGAAA